MENGPSTNNLFTATLLQRIVFSEIGLGHTTPKELIARPQWKYNPTWRSQSFFSCVKVNLTKSLNRKAPNSGLLRLSNMIILI